jgi:hypothetical protein
MQDLMFKLTGKDDPIVLEGVLLCTVADKMPCKPFGGMPGLDIP